MNKLLALGLLGSAALVAGCNSGSSISTPGGTTSSATLPKLMAQLFNGSTSNELSTPLDINTIDVDTASEDSTQFNTLLM